MKSAIPAPPSNNFGGKTSATRPPECCSYAARRAMPVFP